MLGLTKEQEALIRASRSLGAALRIMEFAQRPEGATVEELLDNLQIRAGSFHPRLYELLRTRCLYVAGRRKTRSGHYARVYRTKEGAAFLQYVELRRIAFAKHAARKDLGDTERAVLAVGMKLLKAWRSGGESRRQNALVAFVNQLQRITKFDDETKKVEVENEDDREGAEGRDPREGAAAP